MSLLTVERVSVSYGSHRAVRDVSFQLERDEVLAIVGESGCGKSTLARALVGLEPIEGQVRFDQRPLSWASVSARRDAAKAIQLVFQDASAALDPRMRVSALLEEPLQIHGVARAERQLRVAAALSSVELSSDLLSRAPHELSVGQRQRVGLARGVILEPRVLILDEPVSALDVSVQAQMLQLLVRLRKERSMALLFITHDLNTVAAISQRVAVMYAGRLVEVGPTAEVLRTPKHPYTRALLEASTSMKPLHGAAPGPSEPDVGCSFAPRCARVTEACRATRPSLEGAPQATACLVVK